MASSRSSPSTSTHCLDSQLSHWPEQQQSSCRCATWALANLHSKACTLQHVAPCNLFNVHEIRRLRARRRGELLQQMCKCSPERRTHLIDCSATMLDRTLGMTQGAGRVVAGQPRVPAAAAGGNRLPGAGRPGDNLLTTGHILSCCHTTADIARLCCFGACIGCLCACGSQLQL